MKSKYVLDKTKPYDLVCGMPGVAYVQNGIHYSGQGVPLNAPPEPDPPPPAPAKAHVIIGDIPDVIKRTPIAPKYVKQMSIAELETELTERGVDWQPALERIEENFRIENKNHPNRQLPRRTFLAEMVRKARQEAEIKRGLAS